MLVVGDFGRRGLVFLRRQWQASNDRPPSKAPFHYLSDLHR
jgi:hypothetical protein